MGRHLASLANTSHMDWSRLDIRKRCNPQAGQLVRSNCPKTVTHKVGQRSHPRCTECTRTCPSGWAHFHNDYKNAGSSMASGAVERDGARRPKKIKCHHWKRPPFVSIICQSNPTHTLHSMTYIRILHSTVFHQSPFARQPAKCTSPGHIIRQPSKRQREQTPQFNVVKIKISRLDTNLH